MFEFNYIKFNSRKRKYYFISTLKLDEIWATKGSKYKKLAFLTFDAGGFEYYIVHHNLKGAQHPKNYP